MACGGRSQLKMSEETFDFACTTCARQNKTVEAVKYCIECSGYCCQSCTDAHKIFPTLVGHKLTDVCSGNQASSQRSRVLEFPTERCSKHKEKVVDMYCEGHDAVGCYVCIAKDHKSCPDSHIHSVPDMIDTLFKLSDCKQTHSLLKEMIISMDTHSKSADTQLQELKSKKQKAIDKVTAFHKALEAVVRKLVESSKSEVEAAYKALEKDILQNKHTVDNIRQCLMTSNEKLEQSEGNRAQRFVCSKIAQEKINEAVNEKIKKLEQNTDDEISFIPNESIIEDINLLQSIGQVLRSRKQKRDIYKIKGSKDINIKLPSDTKQCWLYGCCLTTENQLFVTDLANKKLKRIDIEKLSVVDHCTLDAVPHGVCYIGKHEVAVGCKDVNKIQFISIQNKMTPTRHIEISHPCKGITVNDDKLYVTDGDLQLYVYDMTGSQLKTMSQDSSGKKLFQRIRHIVFNEKGDRMFVGDRNNGIVCFDGMGNYMKNIKNNKLKQAVGVCVDNRGNIFAVGWDSNNVMQFSEDGKKLGEVVGMKDGLKQPLAVCFHEGLNSLFVNMARSDVLKMYELD